MASLWLTLVVAGLLTFATRLSFFLLLERWQPPRLFQRALRFVPTAVLSAIIVPEVLAPGGVYDLSPLNPRLLAALAAAFVAWKTHNATITVLVGMLVLWLVGWGGGNILLTGLFMVGGVYLFTKAEEIAEVFRRKDEPDNDQRIRTLIFRTGGLFFLLCGVLALIAIYANQ